MANCITYPLTLTGQTVNLVALNEDHFPLLKDLATNKKIWEFYTFDGSDPNTYSKILSNATVEREKGNQFPFVIFLSAPVAPAQLLPAAQLIFRKTNSSYPLGFPVHARH